MYTNYEEKLGALKPCVKCPHIGVSCFGANMSAVTLTEAIAWCIARKKYLGLNNQAVADKSGVSVHTINKLFTGNTEGCNRETLTRIVKALVDPTGTAAFSTCPFTAGEKVNDAETLRLKEQVQLLEQKLATAEERAEAHLAEAHQDKHDAIEHLKSQLHDYRKHVAEREKVVKVLSALLGVAVIIIIALLWFR